MNNNNQDFEDLKFLTELFGNRDLELDEEVETQEEVEAELKELGYDLSELDQQMETLRSKLVGKLAIKRAAEARQAAERNRRPVVYPESLPEMIRQIQVMEAQMGYAARRTDEMSEKDLCAHFEALTEMREQKDGGEPN